MEPCLKANKHACLCVSKQGSTFTGRTKAERTWVKDAEESSSKDNLRLGVPINVSVFPELAYSYSLGPGSPSAGLCEPL